MAQQEVPQTAITGADSSWLMPFVVLLIAGLLIAAYRFCIIQTVEENGRVVSRCKWPIGNFIATGLKRVFWHQSGGKRGCKLGAEFRASLNPRRRAMLSQVYNGQEIAFGMLIYCWGVCMTALAVMQLGDSPLLLSPAQTILCVALGLAAMIWGVFTVVRRKRNNPFAEDELIL